LTNEVIDIEPISAETIPEAPAEDIQLYTVKVVTTFKVSGPKEDIEPRALERAVWESMPAGYIGGDLFVRYPKGAHDFNVKIEVEKMEEAKVVVEA